MRACGGDFATRVGHIDLVQFGTSRTDSGWTTRREFRMTPTRSGVIFESTPLRVKTSYSCRRSMHPLQRSRWRNSHRWCTSQQFLHSVTCFPDNLGKLSKMTRRMIFRGAAEDSVRLVTSSSVQVVIAHSHEGGYPHARIDNRGRQGSFCRTCTTGEGPCTGLFWQQYVWRSC